MRERRDLKAFFALPDRLREHVRTTGITFLVLVLVGYGVCALRPQTLEPLIRMLMDSVKSAGLAEADGTALMVSILTNNLLALLTAIFFGLIPFLRLPALELGLNAILLGGMAAYYQNAGFGLAAYLAGTLPHGITEIPALILACAAGFHLCGSVSGRLLGREDALPVRQALGDAALLYVRWIVPLLLVSALIEAYATPAILGHFL